MRDKGRMNGKESPYKKRWIIPHIYDVTLSDLLRLLQYRICKHFTNGQKKQSMNVKALCGVAIFELKTRTVLVYVRHTLIVEELCFKQILLSIS